MPPGVAGDPRQGRALFLSRAKGPCTGCHLIPGADVWPAGSVGPGPVHDRRPQARGRLPLSADLRSAHDLPPYVHASLGGDRGLDTRGDRAPGGLSPDPEGASAARSRTRPKPADAPQAGGLRDNLDPTNNPAVLVAEGAEAQWRAKGPAGKACADCHAGGPATAMRGVGTRYPRFVRAYGRVMSIEDFLSVHGTRDDWRAAARRERGQSRHGHPGEDGLQRDAREPRPLEPGGARGAGAGRGVVLPARGTAQSRVRRLPHARRRAPTSSWAVATSPTSRWG